MLENYWKTIYQQEISKAYEARSEGLEGRARVCARRAAGVIAAEYFRRRGLPVLGQNSYDLLAQLNAQPGISPHVRELVDHLRMRVNTDYLLPIGIDLIEDAETLIKVLGLDK